MLVVDTSAALNVLAANHPPQDLESRLGAGNEWHAPHLLDIEILHALRGLLRGGKITFDRAQDARTDFAALPIVRYPIMGLADRIWALRDTLTAYDAAYAALAETLECPLVTCDQGLAAGGHRAAVEYYGPG